MEEGHLLADHVHMLVSIPPKYSVAQVIGYMKGKSAIHIAREFDGRSRSFVGQHFWARCTAPGSLDTHLCYAAWRSSYSSRASIGV